MDPEEVRKQLKKWAVIAAFFAVALVFYALKWRAVLILYVLAVCVVSVLAILLQSGRGGGLSASLGGVGGDSVFGARSATPIAKATYVMLALTVVICMLIARLGARPPVASGPLPLIPRRQTAPAPADLPVAPAGSPAPQTPGASAPQPQEPRQND
jgi:preprotein translocase subunit SecG